MEVSDRHRDKQVATEGKGETGEARDIKLKQTSFLKPRPQFDTSRPRLLPHLVLAQLVESF